MRNLKNVLKTEWNCVEGLAWRETMLNISEDIESWKFAFAFGEGVRWSVSIQIILSLQCFLDEKVGEILILRKCLDYGNKRISPSLCLCSNFPSQRRRINLCRWTCLVVVALDLRCCRPKAYIRVWCDHKQADETWRCHVLAKVEGQIFQPSEIWLYLSMRLRLWSCLLTWLVTMMTHDQ